MITAAEIRAYNDKHECGMYSAKRALAGERLDAILEGIERDPLRMIAAHEIVAIIRLLRIERGA